MKKLLATTMFIFLVLFSSGIYVSATSLNYSGTYSVKPTEGTKSPDPNIGSGSIKPNLAREQIQASSNLPTDVKQYEPNVLTNYIISGNCFIEKTATGEIRGFGDTTASTVVDKIGFDMSFQMWDGYNWITVDTAYNKSYNVSYTYGSYYRSLAKG